MVSWTPELDVRKEDELKHSPIRTIRTTVFINGEESAPRYSFRALLIAVHVAETWPIQLDCEMLFDELDLCDMFAKSFEIRSVPPRILKNFK